MLNIYPVALELIRLMSPGLARVKARSSQLGDQFERALTSVALNLAEGMHSHGRNRHLRYQTACGSVREALACWETAQALGWVAPLDPEIAILFRRVIGTLVRLAKSPT
jgi:four helix bundle protein